jgi:DMSO/TMAO reductase YedYZ molybdopterin-dependent catalytic subunit
LVLFLVAVPLLAQQLVTFPVAIIVMDPMDARIAHAEIRLTPPADSAPAKLETDKEGRLSMQLKSGAYELNVRVPGFRSFSTHVEIAPSKEIRTITVRLEVAMMGGVSVVPADTLQLIAQPQDIFLAAADFKSMPHVTITLHNPHTNADETYSGVPLAYLLSKVKVPLGNEANGMAFARYIVATGSDGYVAVLALAEVDSSVRPGEVLVADAMNGSPLDAHSGPYKLIVAEDKRPARWVRNLASIEVRSLN